jgi:hypothetical protein
MMPLDIDAVMMDFQQKMNEQHFQMYRDFERQLCSGFNINVFGTQPLNPLKSKPQPVEAIMSPDTHPTLDPDTITVGKYYVARRPTMKEQQESIRLPQRDPVSWDHLKIEGKALKCLSVGKKGQVKLLHDSGEDYDDYELYDYRILRLATTEEIKKEHPGDSVCYKSGCPIVVFHDNPGAVVYCDDHKASPVADLPDEVESCICYAPEHCSCKGPGGDEGEIIEPLLLTASEVMEEVVADHYESAAEIVAFRKAQAEINQHALTPGMVAYHIFKHYPCVLVAETNGKWEIELDSGGREKEVEASILSPIVPSRAQRFLAAYKRDTRFRGLTVLLALLGSGMVALGVMALTALAITGSLTF